MRVFTIAILSVVLCMPYSQTAQSAEMKVVDNSVYINTDSYEVEFIDGVITHLSNKLTEEIYTLPLGVGGVTGFRGRSGLLKRDGRSIWTDQAMLTDARKVAPLRARLVFKHGQNEIRLFITVNERTGDLLIEQRGISDTAGVYGIQWGCVNQDGSINILDMVLVGQNLGQKPPSNPRADVNKDGQVNVIDLVLVAEHLGEKVAAAPIQLDIIKSTSHPEEVIAVQRALGGLETVREKSHNVKITIQFLRAWLASANQNVRETKLLPNYPNPFNPETWIPYQLAEAADVSVKIYDVGGRLVRTIPVGFKPVGYYLTRERAAYWDGRNEIGESVSSGVYFVQFVVGEFTATQRVVIELLREGCTT